MMHLPGLGSSARPVLAGPHPISARRRPRARGTQSRPICEGGRRGRPNDGNIRGPCQPVQEQTMAVPLEAFLSWARDTVGDARLVKMVHEAIQRRAGLFSLEEFLNRYGA